MTDTNLRFGHEGFQPLDCSVWIVHDNVKNVVKSFEYLCTSALNMELNLD